MHKKRPNNKCTYYRGIGDSIYGTEINTCTDRWKDNVMGIPEESIINLLAGEVWEDRGLDEVRRGQVPNPGKANEMMTLSLHKVKLRETNWIL